MAETSVNPVSMAGGGKPSTSQPVNAQETSADIKIFGSNYAEMGEYRYLREGLKLTPNIHAKEGSQITVDTSEDGKTMHVAFSGNGWDIDAKSIQDLLIYRENEYGRQVYNRAKTTPPERVIVTVDGNNNRFHGASVAADVFVNGDGNIVQTSNNDDNITINGNSNIVTAYGGDDTVTVEQGSGNNVYLGNGNDKFRAPKDSVANFVWSGELGHDSVKNGTYIKNKNLRKNNFDSAMAKAQKAAQQVGSAVSNATGEACDAAKDIAASFGRTVASIPKGIKTYINGGTEEQYNALGEALREGFRKKNGIDGEMIYDAGREVMGYENQKEP